MGQREEKMDENKREGPASFDVEFPNVWKELDQYQYEHEGDVIFDAIQKHCLDKQRVRRAIYKAMKKVFRADIEEVLREELGLEIK